MRNKETGEFELVVGDRQLLSGFFIFALLLGVVFAMGYFVGQNSPRSAGPPAPASAKDSAPPEARPQPSAPPVQTEQASAQPAAGEEQPPGDAQPQPTTQPAREAIPGAGAPPPPQPPAQQQQQPAAVRVAAGSYWQIMAVTQTADAEAMLKVLRDGGMPAALRLEADGKYHLLVGPYPDAGALAKSKADLIGKFNTQTPFLRRVE